MINSYNLQINNEIELNNNVGKKEVWREFDNPAPHSIRPCHLPIPVLYVLIILIFINTTDNWLVLIS